MKIEKEKLQKSAMFNLFLSSKELFHSNFINWLIHLNKPKMSQVFSKLINITDLHIINCEREKNNFDLYIECEDNKNIIIETKFKSIITEDQLEKYNKKLKEEDIRVLLSLNSSDHEVYLVKKYNWIIINYEDLCSELKKLKNLDKYHLDIIEDYCLFVDEISNYFLEKDFTQDTIKEMKQKYAELNEIKLHDIYQKILFNKLLIKINKKLKEENIDYGQKFVFSKKIASWQDFYRGTGLISLNYTIKDKEKNKSEFRLELQLQYDALKLMLIHEDPIKDLSQEFKDNLFKIIEDLANTKYCRTKGEIFPKNKERMKYKKYGKTLIYKNIILNENITFTEITELFYETFKKVINFGQDIK